jgi:hypothetical protein
MFNYRMSRAGRVVESVFGIFASKWRILDRAVETNVGTGVGIVKCISLLRNITTDLGIIVVCIPDDLSMTPYRCHPHERP